MKKYSKFAVLLSSMCMLFFFGNNIYAQRDTVDVPYGDNTLVDAVKAHPGKVFRLTGGTSAEGAGVYVINESVVSGGGGNLIIIGKKGIYPPPRIVNTQNDLAFNTIEVFGDSLYIENVIFIGRSLDKYEQYRGIIAIRKDRTDIVLKKVWFEFGNYINSMAEHITFLAEDCMFINIIDQEGLSLYQRYNNQEGSFTFRNCSFVNSDGLCLYSKRLAAPHHFTVDHCTFYRILEGVQGGGQFIEDVQWKNSLFVDVAFSPYSKKYGDIYGTLDSDAIPPSIFEIDTVRSEINMERSFSINNNVFWRSPEVDDFYKTLPQDDIATYGVLNSRSQAMVNILPKAFAENNLEFTTDPQVAQGIPFTDTSWELAKQRIVEKFKNNKIRPKWHWFTDDTPDIDWDYKVWPYPLNLKPLNKDLWTMGDDGFPVGDLNWFPDSVKNAWLLTGVKDNHKTITDYHLAQNYPNPFNPSTTIEYSIPKYSDVNISVYNILGQKVVNLVSQKQKQGNYSVTWNGKDSFNNNVHSGIYFYHLKTDNFNEIRKMILLK